MPQMTLKMNSTCQLLVYADGMLGGRVYTIKENAESLVAASKKSGLELSSWSCLEIRMGDEVTI